MGSRGDGEDRQRTPCSHENDMTIEQMKKDMLRDTFRIGGQSYTVNVGAGGWNAGVDHLGSREEGAWSCPTPPFASLGSSLRFPGLSSAAIVFIRRVSVP